MLRIALPLFFLLATLLSAQKYRPYVAILRDVTGQPARVMTTKTEAQDSKGNRYTKEVNTAKGDSRVTLVTASGLYVDAFENVRVMTSRQLTQAEHFARNSGIPDPSKNCAEQYATGVLLPGAGFSIEGRERFQGVEVVKLKQAPGPSGGMIVWRAPSLDCVTLRREMVFAGGAAQGGATRLELVTLSLTEDPSLFRPPKFKEVPPSEFHTAIARFLGGEPNELMKRRFADMDRTYRAYRNRK